MKTKYYIIKEYDKYHRIGLYGFHPKQYDEIYDCPDDVEHVSDFDLIDGKIILNEKNKSARILAEKQKEQELKEKEERERQERIDIKNRIDNYEKEVDKTNDLSELKILLKDVIADLSELAKRVL